MTWVLSGELVHHDSLGTEQRIRPGELNLMTAGHGIAHAEERVSSGPVKLAQLWVAQPATTRDADAAFEHHAHLPQLDIGDGVATVLIGELGDVRSPARRDTDHFAAELDLRGRATVPVRANHEHALIPLHGALEIEGRRVDTAQLAYVAPGREEIEVRVAEDARVLLLGGVPFDEPLVMWWNYVARTREEISAAHSAWTSRSGRFGVPMSDLAPIDVDPPSWDHR